MIEEVQHGIGHGKDVLSVHENSGECNLFV
jgi:hypothetical protein